MPAAEKPLVAVLMGSKSDWEVMRHVPETLDQFGIPYVCRVLSAHRTPKHLARFVEESEANGVEIFIAGAGAAAHPARVVAAHTTRPVLGVPLPSSTLQGLDSLLATVQMPAGIPVATLAIGKAGATNAALLAVAILALKRPEFRDKLMDYRKKQEEKILSTTLA